MAAPPHHDDLELVRDAAAEAAELALSFFRKSPGIWSKPGGSPVTEADLAVDAFLKERLLAARPGYGWLSEETADDPARRGRPTIFVVDPIDGTRNFIEGGDVWCVSIGVVTAGRPVAAALAVPVRRELYTARQGEGAWLAGRRLSVSATPTLAGARLSGPRGWLKTRAVRESGASPQGHVSALAYRFAEVAAGRVDAAFASPRAHDWDLAASDLLVHEAGGRLTGLDGLPLRYNEAVPRHGVLAAANASLHPLVLATVDNASREVTRSVRA